MTEPTANPTESYVDRIARMTDDEAIIIRERDRIAFFSPDRPINLPPPPYGGFLDIKGKSIAYHLGSTGVSILGQNELIYTETKMEIGKTNDLREIFKKDVEAKIRELYDNKVKRELKRLEEALG